MEPIAIPAAIIAFLLSIGCNPTREAYLVDAIDLKIDGRGLMGLYCPFKEEPYCPAENTVYIRKDLYAPHILVHELYHSCQVPAKHGTPEWTLNEKQATSVEYYWWGRE